MKTIFRHTNEARRARGQSSLATSTSRADLDMQLLRLHEEEEYPFRTEVRDGDVYHVWNHKEEGEDEVKLDVRPKVHIA